MGEFFLIVGLLLLTAFIFVAWLCVQVAGMIVRAIFGPRRKPDANVSVAPKGMTSCRNPSCRGANPVHARFCSRCGNPTGAVMRYVA
jgi:hypothetical protein